jgi:hypothetical protein
MRNFYRKPFPHERSVEDAIVFAELKRTELPKVVQVYASDWDRVILTDEIYKLRELLKCQNL